MDILHHFSDLSFRQDPGKWQLTQWRVVRHVEESADFEALMPIIQLTTCKWQLKQRALTLTPIHCPHWSDLPRPGRKLPAAKKCGPRRSG
ncbi:hypothetical protein J6590_085533 [Homalodisca vitripennis]|nr:hypothetical protein J6590_085533 [Homalodisca vitripennis]